MYHTKTILCLLRHSARCKCQDENGTGTRNTKQAGSYQPNESYSAASIQQTTIHRHIVVYKKHQKKNTPPTSHAQVQISPLEMMSAVRNWLRTMEIFMGYLRHLEQVQERTPQERKPKDAQRFSLQNATNPPATEELSIDKALRQELMKIAQGTQPLNMAEAREKVKLKAKFRKIPDLSKTLQSAKSSLTDLGLLLDVERPTSQNSKKKTTSGWVRIARWNQLSNRAKTEAKSLTRQKSTTTNRQRPSLPSAFSCTRPFERILRGL